MRSSRPSLLPGDDPAPPRRLFGRTLLARLRNYLVAGTLVSVPALVTAWVFYRFFLSLDGVLYLLPGSWEVGGVGIKELLRSIPGLGALLTIVAVVGVGFLATNLVGRRVVALTEHLIRRVPILSTIYQGLKQLLEAVFSSDSTRFSEVVYVEYPRRGMWSVGFVTGPTDGAAREAIGRECVNIFIPTTPNPTSGFYLMVPRGDVTHTDLTVEQAFKLIMSAGIVSPGSEGKAAGTDAPVDAPVEASA